MRTKMKIDTAPASEADALTRLEDLLELLFAREMTSAEHAQLEEAYQAWFALREAPNSTRLGKPTPTSDEDVREAFDRLRRVLDAAPRPRYATEQDWLPIQSAYDAWKGSLRPGELQAFFAEQRALRAKVIQAYEASPQALVLDAFERHRGHYYNAVREARRAAGVQARPSHRTRLREAAAAAARDLDVNLRGYDCGRARSDDVQIDESDPRVWKAPEAAA